MCKICKNKCKDGEPLHIYNCQNINSNNIKNISNIKGLKNLNITNVDNIKEIPIIEGLKILYIYSCPNITNIPIIKDLKFLFLYNCKNYYNYSCDYSIYSIKQFNSINKIKKWYKRINFSKILWKYTELVIMDSMNPHKDNNQYLEQYIKDKVYN